MQLFVHGNTELVGEAAIACIDDKEEEARNRLV